MKSKLDAFMTTLNYLILKRVGLNVKDRDGLTPLHYAAKFNNEYGAKRLLKEWTIRIDVIFNILNHKYIYKTK